MHNKNSDIRLNLGCGSRPLRGYINIDSDTIEVLKKRYPQQKFRDDIKVYNFDIFNLPFKNGCVAEVKTDSLIEHLSFIEEPKFFYEVKRVLRPGGIFEFSTTDFEAIVQLWLNAEDDWKDFYKIDDESIKNQHWFGTYTYKPENRWGYLLATLYGSQNGEGQFHKNCYSENKFRAICKRLNLEVISVDHFQWKGDRDHMLGLTAKKL